MYSGKRGDGYRGETIACRYLQQIGCAIRARNYYTPFGEIDIVAEDEEHLIFVEVKLRSARYAAAYGRPSLAVNREKRLHIVRAAGYYISAEPNAPKKQPRIDVMELLTEPLTDGFVAVKINHIQRAFGADA